MKKGKVNIMAETTLRQLVYKAVKEATMADGLTRPELHEYTDYILDHSVLERKADYLSLRAGNLMGIGEENKDRVFNAPQFLTFSINKSIAYDSFTDGSSKTWVMNTHDSFQGLEDMLLVGGNVVIIIDNNIRHHSCDGWDFDAYSLTYEMEDVEEEEVYRSRRKVEERIKELVKQKADHIFVTTTPDLEIQHFIVYETVYSTIEDKGKELMNIEWVHCFHDDRDWAF